MEGYNSIYIQIKDNNNELISNANINWEPLMHMHNMSHSAPFSTIEKLMTAIPFIMDLSFSNGF